MSTIFSPELVLRDLTNLWAGLSGDAGDNKAGVVRACTMTFIVGMNGEDDTEHVSRMVAELMPENPARVVLLRIFKSEEVPGEVTAGVFAQCWLPFGRRKQVCCEQIAVTSPQSLLDDTAKLILALTVPDLPVVLYVRSARLVTDCRFHDLFPLAHKIIIDSERFENPEIAYSFLSSAHNLGLNFADLEWTRLTRLRQLLAQLCENELGAGHIREAKEITIVHADSVSPIAARYLGSWIHSASPGAELTIAPGRRTEMTLTGPGIAISITIEDAGSAILRVNGVTRRASLPELNEQGLLREELSVLGPDAIFQRCFV